MVLGINIPIRTCAVCRNKSPKNELIKIVRFGDEIKIDLDQKINGRSMYICKNSCCIEKAIKHKAINRAFKREIADELYKELKSIE